MPEFYKVSRINCTYTLSEAITFTQYNTLDTLPFSNNASDRALVNLTITNNYTESAKNSLDMSIYINEKDRMQSVNTTFKVVKYCELDHVVATVSSYEAVYAQGDKALIVNTSTFFVWP